MLTWFQFSMRYALKILMFISDEIYLLPWLLPEFTSRWNLTSGFHKNAWTLGLSNEVPTCIFIFYI